MTEIRDFRIFSLGDSAVTVEFGNAISIELNSIAIALSEYFQTHPFPGFIESVPAYASTSLFYDPIQVTRSRSDSSNGFGVVESYIRNAMQELDDFSVETEDLVGIPVHFDPESALDLDYVAEVNKLTPAEVLDIFLNDTYRVFMLGFLPGFPYMGEVDERIATPRKLTPRTSVPKGSVGIAGRQTGIYSLESPGGWQIIGRTEVDMFTPGGDTPCALRPGQSVRFTRA